MDQGSVEGDTSLSVSLGFMQRNWLCRCGMKAGHTQSQLPKESSRGLQCPLTSWATS